MARGSITKTVPSTSGVAETAEVNGVVADGHAVSGLTEKTVITIRNADGAGAHNVTFITQATVGGLAVADRTVSIPLSSTRKFSGFDPRVYGRTLEIDVDSTQLKIQALEP